MASVLTPDELSNPTDGVLGKISAAGQTASVASVQATPNAFDAKPVHVRFSTDERVILLREAIASGAHIAGDEKKRIDLRR